MVERVDDEMVAVGVDLPGRVDLLDFGEGEGAVAEGGLVDMIIFDGNVLGWAGRIRKSHDFTPFKLL